MGKKGSNMEDYYDTNDDFRSYVDGYAKLYCITVKEALKHMIVRLYYEWLKGEKHESKGISSAG